VAKVDNSGRTALYHAVSKANKHKMIDLFLSHPKIIASKSSKYVKDNGIEDWSNEALVAGNIMDIDAVENNGVRYDDS
jgi:hypothetical protein